MDFNARWKKIGEIGQGGQGKVFRVMDRQEFTKVYTMKIAIENLERSSDERFIDNFGEAIMDFVRRYDPNNHGALKVLHQPDDARDFERSAERIRREIEVMASLDHPNLLKILDKDDESKWFVSQYYPRGTLASNLNLFKGNILKALNSFRPLVEAVSSIHETSKIHRDIKPQNIFLDILGNLILGDFGLIFFQDEEHSRISATLENVGSRDWMPMWAQGVKIEDLRPSFDVFGLGKVLWSMISGRPFLRGWYFKDDEFNLELMFPENRFMRLVNNLLSKCVVEREANCVFENAGMILNEIDETKSIIEENASLIDPEREFPCVVCGIGHYVILRNGGYEVRNFGLSPASGHDFKIHICDHCGNVQIFDFRDRRTPPLWDED